MSVSSDRRVDSTSAASRRFLCTGLVLVCALLSSSADAAPAPGVHRIGYLHPGSATLAPIRLDPLRQGLRELGYVEGLNLVLEARWGEGNFERLSALAAELVQL